MKNTSVAISLGLLIFSSSIAFARPPHINKFDADGNVTRGELESASASRAQKIDTNGDGIITLDELQRGKESRKAERMQRHLTEADTNGDGQVGVDEFSAQHVQRIMRHDNDGDGVISESEQPKRGERPPRPER